MKLKKFVILPSNNSGTLPHLIFLKICEITSCFQWNRLNSIRVCQNGYSNKIKFLCIWWKAKLDQTQFSSEIFTTINFDYEYFLSYEYSNIWFANVGCTKLLIHYSNQMAFAICSLVENWVRERWLSEK